MNRILVCLLVFTLFSCGKKEVQLAQLDETVVAEIADHSPIYMFFEAKDNDTLINVNRSNSISSTNWIFNIDKRLPLKLVVPEIQKLQAKKDKSSYKKEGSGNYFSYMDKNKKTLAFLPFGDMEYAFKEPNFDQFTLYFTKNNEIICNDKVVKETELNDFLNNTIILKETEIFVVYDKELSFENYLQKRLFAKKIEIKKLGLSINYKTEYVY